MHREEPRLALTFDDGPNSAVTPKVLDALQRHQARATFFVLGARVAGHEALIQRMYQQGDEVGNHSWNHADFTTLSAGQITQQVAQTQAAVMRAGIPAPTLFRPPYGAVNAVVRSHVPLTLAFWNIDPEDWHDKKPDDIVKKVTDAARPGRVIILHDTGMVTGDAIDPLLTELQKNYQLVTFSELFNLAPGERGEFYGR